MKNAYRIVPVHPDDQPLLGVSWNGSVYFDRALPFGLRSAPKIFTAVSDAMSWVLYNQGIRNLIHYLDDFLIFSSQEQDQAWTLRQLALDTFEELNIPVSISKLEGPATVVTFLEIRIDTVALQLRLPWDKLCRLKELIDRWSGRKSCTRKELESFLGHLSHAASVIRPGRAFMRQLFTLLPLARKPHHRVRLNSSVRADICWWRYFLQDWNGTFFIPPSQPTTQVYSDASGFYVCGAFIPNGPWLQFQ